MPDTIKKELSREKHNFLGSSAWIKEKPGGKFKYEVELGRNYKTKLKGIYYENKSVGRTKGFHSKTDCIKYLKHLEAEARNTDTSISTDSKRDYINAREALDKAGHTKLSITDAIKIWLKHQPIVSDLTVQEAWEEFIEYKIEIDGIQQATIKSLEDCGYRSLKPFINLPLTDFEQPDCTGKLIQFIERKWKGRSRVNHFTKTSEFFGWCMTCQPPKITKNPLAKRRKVKLTESIKQVATVEQTEAILTEAWRTDETEGMLAYWVITLFLGCRPRSEMNWLTWNDIYFNGPKDSFLHVRKSKTGKERRVDLTEQAYEWLQVCNSNLPIFKMGKNSKGVTVPSEAWYRKNRTSILTKAGVLKDSMTTEELKKYQDFQRHTCASAMWFSGEWEHVDLLNHLDHREDTSHKFYKNKMVSKADAKRYLQIMPSTISGNL
jgi:integrase